MMYVMFLIYWSRTNGIIFCFRGGLSIFLYNGSSLFQKISLFITFTWSLKTLNWAQIRFWSMNTQHVFMRCLKKSIIGAKCQIIPAKEGHPLFPMLVVEEGYPRMHWIITCSISKIAILTPKTNRFKWA